MNRFVLALAFLGTVSGSSCTGGTKTWAAFPTGGVWTAAVPTTQTFKPVGDSDNPGCTLADLEGDGTNDGFTDGVDAYPVSGFCAGTPTSWGGGASYPCGLDQAFCTAIGIAASSGSGWRDQSSTKDCTCSSSQGTETAGVQYNYNAGGDPTAVPTKCTAINFGACKADVGGAFTAVMGNTCPAGSTFVPHDDPNDGGSFTHTASDIQIGFCKASDGKSPAGVDITSPKTGGFCATEEAQCFEEIAAACSTGFPHGHALKYTSMTQTECGNPGVCYATTGSGYSASTTKTADATEQACCESNGGTWGASASASASPTVTPAATPAASGAVTTRAVAGLLVVTAALAAALQ